ncbi:MAG: histidine kinase [Spirulina sp. SIO3F2]|nr:histidine kinase [Spirulina sp. SIO3F2]
MVKFNPKKHPTSLPPNRPSCLRLLLFVDERSGSQQHTQQILDYLNYLEQEHLFELEVLEVGEHPDLAEHFRLIATPSLVRIYPQPKHVLAGGDLVAQLKRLWSQWQEDTAKMAQASEDRTSPTTMTLDIVSDPLEQIQLAEEIFRLKRENEELQEQLHFKNQILEMFVHDLRNPLTAASIAVETLKIAYQQPDFEKFRDLFPQLYRQARAQFQLMNRMISDILQATKGQSGALQLQLHSVALGPLCQELLQQFTERIQNHRLNMIEDIPQDLPRVYADAELIRQVLTNLLDNAIKYTPPGGNITISLLHRTSQKIQVSIIDTGLGIPPEKQNHIFEGHFRLKRDAGIEGYGIGLSLCRQVVNAHYGRIWVNSVPQEGSAFHFTLPVCR